MRLNLPQLGSRNWNNAPLLDLLEVPVLLELIFPEPPPLLLDPSTPGWAAWPTLLLESACASVILTSLLDLCRELWQWVASSRPPDELELDRPDEDLPDLSFDSMFILTMAPVFSLHARSNDLGH